jgi:hypothetical protein
MLNRNLIINIIPWDLVTARKKPVVGEWVNKKEPDRTAPPDLVYQITDTNHDTASAKEFQKLSKAGRIQATNSHDVIIPLEGYERVRVLEQESHGVTLRLAKDVPPWEKTPYLLDLRVRLHFRAPVGSRRLAVASDGQHRRRPLLRLFSQEGLPKCKEEVTHPQ